MPEGEPSDLPGKPAASDSLLASLGLVGEGSRFRCLPPTLAEADSADEAAPRCAVAGWSLLCWLAPCCFADTAVHVLLLLFAPRFAGVEPSMLSGSSGPVALTGASRRRCCRPVASEALLALGPPGPVALSGALDARCCIPVASGFPRRSTMAADATNWSSMETVASEDPLPRTSRCTDPPAGVPCDEAAFGGIASGESSELWMLLLLSSPPISARYALSSGDVLDAASLRRAENVPTRAIRAGAATLWSVALLMLPSPADAASAADEDIVSGVAEVADELAIAREPGVPSKAYTADNLREPGYPSGRRDTSMVPVSLSSGGDRRIPELRLAWHPGRRGGQGG